MGLMKTLHTRQTEDGHLVGAERKFVEATQQAEVSVAPEYTTGVDGRLILGFPESAINQFKRSKTLYFISWSVNFKDYQKFRDIAGIYACPKFQDAKEGRGVIPVKIDGPYDVKGFTKDHLPCSPYKSLEEIEAGMENWGRHNVIAAPYPLFLWMATPA